MEIFVSQIFKRNLKIAIFKFTVNMPFTHLSATCFFFTFPLVLLTYNWLWHHFYLFKKEIFSLDLGCRGMNYLYILTLTIYFFVYVLCTRIGDIEFWGHSSRIAWIIGGDLLMDAVVYLSPQFFLWLCVCVSVYIYVWVVREGPKVTSPLPSTFEPGQCSHIESPTLLSILLSL